MAKKTTKGKRSRKVNIQKKRRKLQKQQKKYGKEESKVEKKKSEQEEKLELRLQKETKLYWARAIMGPLTAFVGRLLLGLVGWYLVIWMAAFWLGFPFIVNTILGYKYEEEEWTWKNVIKPGIGIFFFLFMIVGVFIHTMLAFYCQDLGGAFCNKVTLF